MEMRTNPAEIHQTMYYRKIGQKQKGACSIQVLVYLRTKTGTSSAIHMQKRDGCCIVWGTCKTEGSAVNTNRMNLYRCHQPDMRTHKHWTYFRRNKVYACWKLHKTSMSVTRGSHFQVHFVWQVWDGQLSPSFKHIRFNSIWRVEMRPGYDTAPC